MLAQLNAEKFTADFLQNVKDVRDQVSELVGFLALGAPSPNVVLSSNGTPSGSAGSRKNTTGICRASFAGSRQTSAR